MQPSSSEAGVKWLAVVLIGVFLVVGVGIYLVLHSRIEGEIVAEGGSDPAFVIRPNGCWGSDGGVWLLDDERFTPNAGIYVYRAEVALAGTLAGLRLARQADTVFCRGCACDIFEVSLATGCRSGEVRVDCRTKQRGRIHGHLKFSNCTREGSERYGG